MCERTRYIKLKIETVTKKKTILNKSTKKEKEKNRVL